MAKARVLTTVAEMRREALVARALSRRIAFVPTMGYLHAGHVSLLEEARRVGDLVVLSIFVNPSQFGPQEDLARYPRDLDGDVAKAEAAGCDLVFAPGAAEMYPEGYQTWVDVQGLSQGLCGDKRPGHFRGVATVVLKLLNIVQPHVAIFGEKDYQQLQVLRRMARDLDLPTIIASAPILREPDGLAMSSRNAFLSVEDRVHALALHRALLAARERFRAGDEEAEALLAAARAVLDADPAVRLDYLELRDAESLETVRGPLRRPVVLAVAAFVGTTRLIDNIVLRD